jgi:hypothetical protein
VRRGCRLSRDGEVKVSGRQTPTPTKPSLALGPAVGAPSCGARSRPSRARACVDTERPTTATGSVTVALDLLLGHPPTKTRTRLGLRRAMALKGPPREGDAGASGLANFAEAGRKIDRARPRCPAPHPAPALRS